jgi:hypothetical protein
MKNMFWAIFLRLSDGELSFRTFWSVIARER